MNKHWDPCRENIHNSALFNIKLGEWIQHATYIYSSVNPEKLNCNNMVFDFFTCSQDGEDSVCNKTKPKTFFESLEPISGIFKGDNCIVNFLFFFFTYCIWMYNYTWLVFYFFYSELVCYMKICATSIVFVLDYNICLTFLSDLKKKKKKKKKKNL